MKTLFLSLLTIISIYSCTAENKESYTFEGIQFTCAEKLNIAEQSSELLIASVGDDFVISLGKNNKDLAQTASTLVMTVGGEAVKDKWSLGKKWIGGYWTQSFGLDDMPSSFSIFYGEYQLDSDTKIQILIIAKDEKKYADLTKSVIKSIEEQ